MAFEKIFHTVANKLDSIPIVDGQVIYVKDTHLMYVDMDTDRILINSNDVKSITNTNGKLTITKNDGTTSTIEGDINITGNLRLKTGSNYGCKLQFGDGDLAYIHENTDDHLNIYASKGIDITTNGNTAAITANGIPIGALATQTTNGLISAADKKKLDLNTPKAFSIATSGWTAVTASSYGGYSYRASISDSNITANDSADVRFALSCIAVCLTAQVSPAVTTAAGIIYVFAKTKPTAALSGVYLIQKA